MSGDLYRMCGLDESEPLRNKCILVVEDIHHDASFSLALLSKLYLNCQSNVILFSFRQSKNHYINILSKFGLKLPAFESARQFIFYDGMKFVVEKLMTKEYSTIMYEECVHELYESIKGILSGMCSDMKKPFLLVIDDLNILETLGFPDRHVVNFLSYLKTLVYRNNGCILPLIHLSQEDKVNDHLISELSHPADIIINISPLSTGYCREIDGQVICSKKDWASVCQPQTEKMHYRLLATGQVKFIAPGMSAAVL